MFCSAVLPSACLQPDPAKFSVDMSGKGLCAWATRTGFSANDVDALREGKYDGEKVASSRLIELQRAGVSLDGATRLRDEVDRLDFGEIDPESWRQTTSTGLEMEATREAANRAVQKSQYLRGALGELKAVAEGRSVKISETLKFQAKQGEEKIVTRDRVQLDGVFLTSKVVVMNEAKGGVFPKWCLSKAEVKECVSKSASFEVYLKKMINSPDAFHTDPPEAKAELVQAGLTEVRVVMSCHSARPDAEEECKIERFFVCKPNGDAFSVEEASTTP